ncbi:glycoside hydrolase family 36 protein [Bifidobacterium callimiconis]|uniref:Alpha-galactosidase n=1 Tax=Bifidobacterium callimiconis TaxID=2306973 RepID=A0A430F9M3_9BIFI|nr:glycoside hydrolase family 36 protein [Bifidobacterium callimiconis]MBT1175989.1 alpha-galactosidase [Bifidobacterium callimiconis]RSX49534.1 alpha-galactosidase [Bifidobacterium callimiconis]
MRTILLQTTVGGTTAVYRRDTETGIVELLLVPADVLGDDGSIDAALRDDCAAESLVQAKIIGDDYPFGFSQGRTMRNSQTVARMEFGKPRALADDNGVTTVTTRIDDPRGWHYEHVLTMTPASQAVEIHTSVVNDSAEPITFEMLSSFTLGSLSPFATGLDPENLTLHRMRSTWSAEGRLLSQPVEDLELEPSWQRFSANSVRFGSVGSFPVREWVPFVGITDRRAGVTWAAATTHASSWQIEAYRRDEGLSLSGGIADREFGQWTHTVKPGERFDAPKAVLAVVRGDVNLAAQAVAGNVRQYVRTPESENHLPIIFNEFCSTWGVPTEKSVLEQLDAVKALGVEYFVIDAGWFDDTAFESASRFGKWEVSKTAFPHGLKPVVDAIHAAGMKAGIWFEFEIAGRQEPDCFNRTEWLLTRDGLPITSGNRRWWDMRNPDVRDYLAHKVIDMLRDNGFDYMKVDYNDTIGVGCETPGDPDASLGDGLYSQIQASQDFFRRIRRELPDLMIEICASGGHRLVQSFMEIGAMASFSDAHECDEIPVIAANMHRMILPRQSQIWAVVRDEEPASKLYYQICSGLLGRLCFSGDANAFSGEKNDVIHGGVDFYRAAAPIIDHGVSAWHGPALGSYRHPRGWQAIVRRGEHGTDAQGRTLVVLHTFHDAPENVTISLDDVNGGDAAGFADVIARAFHRDGIDVTLADGTLTVSGLTDFDGVAVLL